MARPTEKEVYHRDPELTEMNAGVWVWFSNTEFSSLCVLCVSVVNPPSAARATPRSLTALMGIYKKDVTDAAGEVQVPVQ
jgi:hypothetical protein